MSSESDVLELESTLARIQSGEPRSDANLYLPFSFGRADVATASTVAHKLMSGEFTPHAHLAARRLSCTEIDWDEEYSDSPNTYLLWLHSLRYIVPLAHHFWASREERAICLAHSIVAQWASYECGGVVNRYTWYDHSVAERTEALTYLADVTERSGWSDGARSVDLRSMIRRHAAWLADQRNYVPRHNHGMIEDGALIHSAMWLDDEANLKLGVDRLKAQVTFAFPNRAAHVENSSGYHAGIVKLLLQIQCFVASFDSKFSFEIGDCYSEAVGFLHDLYGPNGSFLTIGDTFGSKPARADCAPPLGVSLIDDGDGAESQERPARWPRVQAYVPDGYVFFRGRPASQGGSDSYLAFRAGLISTTHKHADDLSVVFQACGFDVFVDPGMYSYMMGNLINDYLSSAFSHSTVFIDESTYAISSSNVGRAGLSSSVDYGGEISVVQGFNDQYDEATLSRSIVWVGDRQWVIVDEAGSDTVHDYTQNFHLGPNISVLELDSDGARLGLGTSGKHVVVKQLLGADRASSIGGLTSEIETMSLASRGLNSYEADTSIRFSRRGRDTQFITSIEVVEREPDIGSSVDVVVRGLSAGTVTLGIGSNAALVPRRRPVRTARVVAAVDGRHVEVMIDNQERPDWMYCYYLLDKTSGVVRQRSGWLNINGWAPLLQPGYSYAVVCYARTPARDKIRWLGGYLVETSDSWVWQEVPLGESIPRIGIIRRLDRTGSSMLFEISAQFTQQPTFQWYVYRNGSSYAHMSSRLPQQEYTFSESGTYAVVVRVRDIYWGEVAVSHTPEFTVDEP